MSRPLGYTLIELIIVIAIIGMIAVLALYGLRSQNSNQLVQNAQLEFVANLRSVINSVNQGGDGQSFKYLTINAGSNSYVVNKGSDGLPIATYSLPAGVYICPPSGLTTAICAANPNLAAYTAGQNCKCGVGSYFACQSDSARIGNTGPASVTIRFTTDSACAAAAYYKDVVIEGNGISITRVNPL